MPDDFIWNFYSNNPKHMIYKLANNLIFRALKLTDKPLFDVRKRKLFKLLVSSTKVIFKLYFNIFNKYYNNIRGNINILLTN